jgi:uncharacterized protein YlzI (FlbEa/FlbD family)
MIAFLELTGPCGDKRLVNVALIESVHDDHANGTLLRMSNGPGMPCQESYAEIHERLAKLLKA